MASISKQMSLKLSNLMVFCTMLITMMHLPYAGVNSVFAKVPLLIYVTHLAVPIFFFVSGFLMGQRVDDAGWYFTVLRKRFKTLVIPYFAMNTLMIPLLFVYHNLLNVGNWPAGGMGLDWYTIVRVYGLSWNFHPACGGLWYVRCLIFFIVLSPVLLYIIKLGWKATWLLLSLEMIAFILAGNLIHDDFLQAIFYSFFNIRGLFLFTLGIVCARDDGIMSLGRKLRWRLILSALLVIVLSAFIGNFYGIASIIKWAAFLLGFFLIAPEKVVFPSWVVQSCFAIYVIHSSVYAGYCMLMRRFGVTLLSENVFCSLIPFVLMLGICFGITWVVRNYTPRLGQILFGGRC